MTLADPEVAIPLAIGCVLVSAFCSGSEVALFTLRRVDREQLAKSDLGADRRILRMLERPRRLIATVLIGSQAFNALLAVIALAVSMRHSPLDSIWAQAGIALAITLPLVVLISEVLAKTLAAKAPLAWARAASLPLMLFAVSVTPVRLVVFYASELLLRPLGQSARTRPARDLSEEEFRTLVDAGSAQGQVDARERRLIHRVFEFNDKNVGQVMTPRERIFAMAYDLPMQRLVRELAARGFSRVPIYQKSVDNIRGIVHAKDLVRAAATGKPIDKKLGDLLHEPLFVPRTTPVKRLFLTFKQKKVHMAIVVSEYGKVLGLVTMDDLLAQIFGVLRDERADLQNSIPPGRMAVRTPAVGTPIMRPGSDAGIVKSAVDPDPDATGPVNKEDDDSGPTHRRPDTHDSGPMRASENELSTRESVPVVDRPTPPGLRNIHHVDEVTPPAADVQDLIDQGGKRR